MEPKIVSRFNKLIIPGLPSVLFVFWILSFFRMLAGGNPQVVAVANLLLGIVPLLFLGFMFLVRRYALYEDRLVILNYWKKEKQVVKWSDVETMETLSDETLSGDKFKGAILLLREGKRMTMSNVWAGNMVEILRFMETKIEVKRAIR
jgi:hypothetical protein